MVDKNFKNKNVSLCYYYIEYQFLFNELAFIYNFQLRTWVKIAGINAAANKENATGADLMATVVARDQNGTKMDVMGKWEGKTDTNAPQVSHNTHLGKKKS